MLRVEISALYSYPVKSCAAVSLAKTRLVDHGLEHDRAWVIVNKDMKVLTQRDYARMALIRPSVSEDGTLTLHAPGCSPHAIPTITEAKAHQQIEVWGNACAGYDQGEDAARWLGDFLNAECRLLRHDKSSLRQTKQTRSDGSKGSLTFVDSCPLLVVSEESLEDLNQRASQHVHMDRFRPSIVIKGLGPYAEDKIKRLTINGLSLNAAKPCARCVITTIDQTKGVLDSAEPLRTLSTFRKDGEKVNFGHYFTLEGSGHLSVGDTMAADF
ncbi:MAG TPA: MOSC N-terminal beta barrel domain-containing protein [Candidatus Obscuribacterales bacterium]